MQPQSETRSIDRYPPGCSEATDGDRVIERVILRVLQVASSDCQLLAPLVETCSLRVGTRVATHGQVAPLLMILEEVLVKVGLFPDFYPERVDDVLLLLAWLEI